MKILSTLKIFVLCLSVGACASSDNWPTVSFGHDVAATNKATAERPEISLAPLPMLLPEDTRGSENPEAFLKTIYSDYKTVVVKLSERFEDYSRARQSMITAKGEALTEGWLSAQMELSNISQYTEGLPKMRARILALGDLLSGEGAALLLLIEDQELHHRLFIRREKLELAALEPG